MCIALPCKLVEVNGDQGVMEIGGTRHTVLLDLVDGVKEGDYVIVHAGYAISKVEEGEALARLQLVSEMNLDDLMS